jgi:hypothetical protein
MFEEAAREEEDHLAWTAHRLKELDSRPSLLNPLWYAGALAIGVAAGTLGDKVSLGFMAETERQVENHLEGHLSELPAADTASRAIVDQMRIDEVKHGKAATDAGGVELPLPARMLMRAASKVMTSTAYYSDLRAGAAHDAAPVHRRRYRPLFPRFPAPESPARTPVWPAFLVSPSQVALAHSFITIFSLQGRMSNRAKSLF